MMKIICLIICLISTFSGSSTSADIECSYGLASYTLMGVIYECTVDNNPNIIAEESAEISGNHRYSETNDDVIGFHAYSKTIHFFPKGLDTYFINLKVINIQSCELKEIHQSDLKPFPNLVYFSLMDNGIEVIEAGLFDSNPNLEFVGFQYETKIKHIDPNVFDQLPKLRYFYFANLPCIDLLDVVDSKEKLQEAKDVLKSNCSNSDFFSIDNQSESFEI